MNDDARRAIEGTVLFLTALTFGALAFFAINGVQLI